MSIDLKHMLKVYNYINDEKRPKFNYKFLGLFAALLVATGALVAFAIANYDSTPATVEGPVSNHAASQTRTDYVGLSPSEVDAGVTDAGLVQARLDSWRQAHPRAEIVQMTPAYDDGRLIGYTITYRPA